MHPIGLALLLVCFIGGDDGRKENPSKREAQSLVDAIESLQQPVDDFRCEFEGAIHLNRQAQKVRKLELRDDGFYESYSGVFIWRRGGDIYIDVYRRRAPGNAIERETLVVRLSERNAETYIRPNEATTGVARLMDPNEVFFSGWRGFPLYLFSIAYLDYVVPVPGTDYWFEDGQIDGQPLRIINVGFFTIPGALSDRYWIDLRRNGHVVRREFFDNHIDSSGKPVRTRQTNTKLAPYRVGGNEIWMPVSGQDEWYARGDPDTGKNVVREDDPWWLEKINITDGTMEINKHPGPEVFRIKYKPGTPISDNLRKLQYEYGQQRPPGKPTKAEAEKMLNEQVAKAEEQKSTLVVASTSEGFAWSTWFAWGFGALVVVWSVVLWVQRRGR